MVAPLWALNAIKNLCSPKNWAKVHRNFWEMLHHKSHNHAKFCADRLKNAGDICDRKFMLPEKVGQSSPTFLGMLPPKTYHYAKFHRDWSNQLGKWGGSLGLGQKFFVTDGQKRDYLSRDSQCARGTTKNTIVFFP